MITAGSNGKIAGNFDAAAFQFQYSCNKGILLCDLRAAEGSLSVVPYFVPVGLFPVLSLEQ